MLVMESQQETQINSLPTGWRIATLGRLCRTITTGRLDANAMVPDGEYRFYTCAREHYYINQYAFDGEALLISGNGAHVGYVHYYDGRFNAYQRTYVLMNFFASAKYLQYYLNKTLTGRLATEVKAGNTPYIVRGTLADMPVVLPVDRNEQDAIARALTDADAYIESLEQLLAKKRAVMQGSMHELLTGKRRLSTFVNTPGFKSSDAGLIPNDWQTIPLGKCVARLGNGIVYEPAAQGGCPITRIETIASGKIDMTRVGYAKYVRAMDDYALKDGDILYSHINSVDHIGKVAQYSKTCGRLYHGMNLVALRPSNTVCPRFLFYVLRSERSRRTARTLAKQAVNQASINTLELRGVVIIAPSSKTEQEAIASILSDMDSEIDALEGQIRKARDIKQGMMQELLTGKVRLV